MASDAEEQGTKLENTSGQTRKIFGYLSDYTRKDYRKLR
jgi:hypothetical protein